MQFVELAADYLRQHHYNAQAMSPPPFNIAGRYQSFWESPKAVFWAGYPKPAVWFAETDKGEIKYAFYRTSGKRKMRKMRYSNDLQWEHVGYINEPTILDKILKIVSNPPYWLRDKGDVILPNPKTEF